MWILRKIGNEGTVKYLVSARKQYTLGRKNSDIILPEDSSISRTHCVINVAQRNECPFPVVTFSGVWIVDKKSKYGTYINRNEEWIKVEGEKVEEVTDGNVIRFGLLDNIWRLEYKPLVACISRIVSEEKQKMKFLMEAVDGELINNFTNQCTITFVNDITLTAKVLLSLINGVPIVTPKYLHEYHERVTKNEPLPDVKLFRPKIVESTLIPSLVSLDHEHNRRELFKGKKFYIPTVDQLENLKGIIRAGGGSCELLHLTGSWRLFAEEDAVVIQLPYSKIINPDESAISFKQFAGVLKSSYGVRVVPETEIFQAVAYASVENYCNPRSQAFEIRNSSERNHSMGDVITEETPMESVGSEIVKSTTFCPSSFRDASSSTRKRIHSPELDVGTKKFARQNRRGSSISGSNSSKTDMDGDSLDLFLEEDDVSGVSGIKEQNRLSNKPTGSNDQRRRSVDCEQNSPESENEEIGAMGNANVPPADGGDIRKSGNEAPAPVKFADVEPEKRKLPETSGDDSREQPAGKRQRISAVGKNSKSVKATEKIAATRKLVPGTLERFLDPGRSKASKTANDYNTVLIEEGWIEMKSYKSETDDGCDLEENCHNFKIFKQKEKSRDSDDRLTGEECEKLRRMLLADGWSDWNSFQRGGISV